MLPRCMLLLVLCCCFLCALDCGLLLFGLLLLAVWYGLMSFGVVEYVCGRFVLVGVVWRRLFVFGIVW